MSVLKPLYGTDGQLTLTGLASLASSATRVAGWTSAFFNNATDRFMDRLVSGQFQVNTTTAPTAGGLISVYAYAAFDDTPTWPDLFSAGTEGAVGAATVHDEEQRDFGMMHLWTAVVDANTSRVYAMPPRALASAFGGMMPTHIALWVVQSTGQTLSATNNALYHQPMQLELV